MGQPPVHKLEQLLNEQKLSLQKASELTGVSTLALEYMIGQNSIPKRHIAQKLAKLVDVKVGEIWPSLAVEEKPPQAEVQKEQVRQPREHREPREPRERERHHHRDKSSRNR